MSKRNWNKTLNKNIKTIKQCSNAITLLKANPQLVKLFVNVGHGQVSAPPEVAKDVAMASAVLKGTPLAMSTTAKVVSGTLTGVFVVIDVVYLVKICIESKTTPTVKALREFADKLEKECEDIKSSHV